MKIYQQNGIQTSNYLDRAKHVIDRDLIDQDFDLLRARVRNRSIWAVRMHRMQEVTVTVMALLLGAIMGWALIR